MTDATATYTIVDVSNNNGGTIDWARVKAAGICGVLLKATEGTSFTDGTYATRRAAATAAGLHVGAYHFAHPEEDAVAQAEYFCSVIGKLKPTEFKPVLDLEIGTPSPALTPWIKAFNQQVSKELGWLPIFYSYSSYITSLKLESPVGNGLWLASYGRNDGQDYGAVVPAPWKKWNLHQYTSSATVGGIVGKVDLSHATTLNGLLAKSLS